MTVNFTPDQEAQLSDIAASACMETENFVKKVVMRTVERESKSRAALRESIAQADRGELIDDDVVRRWLEERERERT